ncbi:MAG: hypothetical protein JRH20_29065, partial [Deltaproteobacteria bacterium]|nr:hypothetical protein [Deltaproteobacteria bacterium]
MPIRNRHKITLSQRTYELLVRDLRKLLVDGKLHAEAAAGRELVLTYHALGRRILKAKLTERAGYASALMQRLA